jgi:mono/diheme cytochrome c family protein
VERYWLGWGIMLLLAAAPIVPAQASPAVQESFFADKLYPVLHRAQCNLCHNDNGVASGTRFNFPVSGPMGKKVPRSGSS